MNTTATKEYTLILDAEEHAMLLRLLEDELVETHAELRRTEAPVYRDRLHAEETRLQRLTAKVRQLNA